MVAQDAFGTHLSFEASKRRVSCSSKSGAGAGGGGGGSTTSVGTAVSGGVTYNFDMTFNLSGITDSTDKREMAREIGDLIQQEITRSTGGGRMRGRNS